MTKRAKQRRPDGTTTDLEITRIMVRDFKSLVGEQSIEIRPLTILAGANSAGKSSIMQPLLMMKQTLEAGYDPGAFKLDGPNVKFTGSQPLFSKIGRHRAHESFSTGFEVDGIAWFQSKFERKNGVGLDVVETAYHLNAPIGKSETNDWVVRMNETLSLQDARIPNEIRQFIEKLATIENSELKAIFGGNVTFNSIKDRFFLTYAVSNNSDDKFVAELSTAVNSLITTIHVLYNEGYKRALLNMFHLPGLRGNPARTYPVSGTGPMYPGTFENYAASVLYNMQMTSNNDSLNSIFSDLIALGLTWTIIAKSLSETEFELKIGRLPKKTKGGDDDLVNIADVGLGVSQVLAIVVALHAAKPGQLVYIEQPEIHLHPRAQTAMAGILAKAALRGVQTVVETHSELLILGIRTLVAEDQLSPGIVKFHWFERDRTGVTKITPADLDENGGTTAWPEDFAEVQLQAQARYLDAAGTRSKGR